MRKGFFLLPLALCFIFAACGGQTAVHLESPPSNAQPTVPAPDSEIEPISESGAGIHRCFPIFERVKKIYAGQDFYGEWIAFTLSDEERARLWQLMRVDDWIVASDSLELGRLQFYIVEHYNNEFVQTWFFSHLEEQTLIVPSLSNEDGVKTVYFAPACVITDIMAYVEMLMPQSNT